jgi:carbonic anhydrase
VHDLMTAARRFPQTVSADPARYAKLAAPQEPEVLLITCSDSRVVPEALLDTGPGHVFELRNAGGIVPRYSPGHPGAEQATVEYAIEVLGIRDVVVAGHSSCGAVSALVGREVPSVPVPEVTGWLAPLTVPEDDETPERLDGAPPLARAVQQHVLHQVEALSTHPVIGDEVTVHPWFIDLTRGQVLRHDPVADAFVAL